MNRLDNLNAIKKRTYTVSRSNEIIQTTANNYTINEYKFILIALTKITKDDAKDKLFSMEIKEFCDILNIKDDSYLNKRFENYFKSLADKSAWYIKPSGDKDLIRWFSSVSIKEDKVYYKFAEEVREHIFDLKNYFTNYQLWNVVLLSTRRAIEFYEFLKSISNLHVPPVFEVDNIQAKFNISYKTYSEFKRTFLVKNIEEINKKTDLYVEFKEIKKGRKVDKIEFHISTLRDLELNNRYVSVENAIQLKEKEPVSSEKVREIYMQKRGF